jgi:hypothetical protein
MAALLLALRPLDGFCRRPGHSRQDRLVCWFVFNSVRMLRGIRWDRSAPVNFSSRNYLQISQIAADVGETIFPKETSRKITFAFISIPR